MGDKSSIEWTEATWNPVAGCSIISPGCTNCYAMKMAARIEAMDATLGHVPHYRGLTKRTKAGAVWTGKMAVAPDSILTLPLRWKRPRRIFVNSMSDLFHEGVADETIDRVFAVMALAPHHTFQVLTKRAERMMGYMAGNAVRDSALAAGSPWPLPNVWLGVSAEDQRRAEERIPHLLATPAAVRWVSAEPLLGPLRLDGWLRSKPHDVTLDWLVAGGESGPGARPPHPDWFRSLRDQCAAAGVPYFFKQWGNFHPSAEHDNRAMGCKRDPLAIHVSGEREHRPLEAGWKIRERATGWAGMCDLGKKRAGAKLDGVEHREWPL